MIKFLEKHPVKFFLLVVAISFAGAWWVYTRIEENSPYLNENYTIPVDDSIQADSVRIGDSIERAEWYSPDPVDPVQK